MGLEAIHLEVTAWNEWLLSRKEKAAEAGGKDQALEIEWGQEGGEEAGEVPGEYTQGSPL